MTATELGATADTAGLRKTADATGLGMTARGRGRPAAVPRPYLVRTSPMEGP
ncbi:hypothetical protein [Streptomyces kanamyceticus]|uniref:Uncharacterized protein n=1 Tax=Streptomyces kanamyceticus TaxID=1967 RepID=Q6L736_STRKN|nr:hypothetical protein [Streptomyces kanamyceticus]BAD20761.1 hypothetical protein [Streptomyces kanamyceticus]